MHMDYGIWDMGYGPYSIVHAASCVQHFGVLSTSFSNHGMGAHLAQPEPVVQLIGLLSLQARFLMLYVLGDCPIQHAHSDRRQPDELRSLRLYTA